MRRVRYLRFRRFELTGIDPRLEHPLVDPPLHGITTQANNGTDFLDRKPLFVHELT